MASRLQDVIQRGTSGARPAANTVAPGTIYFSTDTGSLDRSDGTNWQTYSGLTTQVKTRQITAVIGDGVSVISTGVVGFASSPYTGTITKARILSTDAAVTSGSIVVDVWKDTYANYPPTVADTITASAKPTLSSAIKNEDSTLTGWTTSVTAGDIFGFNVDSVTSLKKVTLELTIVVTG